ncbi:unnamed protein product [Amoebophrya sp. A25]|nr:unnamed protein product [Amoebophrya sp. A25]|eukprot:GSA25T00020687001.1
MSTSDRKPRGRGRVEDEDDRYDGESGRFERLDEDGMGEAAKSVEGWVIVIAGIHEETQEEDIYERFSEYGAIKNMHLNLDRRSGYVKGYCFLEYEHKDEAALAIREQHGAAMLGEKMVVSWAFTKGDPSKSKKRKRT